MAKDGNRGGNLAAPVTFIDTAFGSRMGALPERVEWLAASASTDFRRLAPMAS